MKKYLLRCYAEFLRLYPVRFRVHYGREMQMFMRDYARDRGPFALLMLLFSDLLVSLPREHYREVHMRWDSKTIVSAFIGLTLLVMVALQIAIDVRNPDEAMGFFLVLVITTMAIGGAFLLLQLRETSRNILWFVPAVYAAVAGIWIMITPMEVTDASRRIMPFLMSIGQPAALTLLYVPAVIAVIPAFVKNTGTIATVALSAFAIVVAALMGAYYVPAAIAMLLVRAVTSRRLVAA